MFCASKSVVACSLLAAFSALMGCASEETHEERLVGFGPLACTYDSDFENANDECERTGNDNDEEEQSNTEQPPMPLPMDGGPLCSETSYCVDDPNGGEQWMKWAYFMAGPRLGQAIAEAWIPRKNRVFINALFTYVIWDGEREVPGENTFEVATENGNLAVVYYTDAQGVKTLLGVHGWVPAQTFCSTILGVGQTGYVSLRRMYLGPNKQLESIPLRNNWVICTSTEPWLSQPPW